MSANIYWRPVDTSRNDLPVSTPSMFIDSMREAFGQLPVKLGPGEIPVLKGMASVKGFGTQNDAFKVLIEKIEQIGEIEVWAEW